MVMAHAVQLSVRYCKACGAKLSPVNDPEWFSGYCADHYYIIQTRLARINFLDDATDMSHGEDYPVRSYQIPGEQKYHLMRPDLKLSGIPANKCPGRTQSNPTSSQGVVHKVWS